MALNQEQLKFFAQFIEKELGIVYSDMNFFQLEHRLNDIAVQQGLQNVEELWLKSKQGIEGNFKALLLDLATNNETSFFRDAAVFRGLEQFIVPELLSKNPSLKEVKIWSAACSSGQEPYSIAITFEMARERNPLFPDYSIFASDFSDRMLARAKSRTYSQLEVQRGISAKELISYFSNGSDNNTWTVNSRVPSSKITFEKVNLLDDWNFHKQFHVIFCRNVLIYQNVENKTKVVEKLIKHLEAGGFLILGAAESMLGISNQFEQIHFENAVYYRKK